MTTKNNDQKHYTKNNMSKTSYHMSNIIYTVPFTFSYVYSMSVHNAIAMI